MEQERKRLQEKEAFPPYSLLKNHQSSMLSFKAHLKYNTEQTRQKSGGPL